METTNQNTMVHLVIDHGETFHKNIEDDEAKEDFSIQSNQAAISLSTIFG